jgi:multicomponent Na+:H+ antiporter subunit F
MVIISIISFVLRETYFIDVVMVYALIGFIATVVISKYIEVKANANK